MFDAVLAGLPLFLTVQTLVFVTLGVVFGLVVGALAGLSPLMGMILVLPFAIGRPPIPAIGLLSGIIVAGPCVGSVSAILLGIPGTPLAAATLFDGYPMAQGGRGADAIGLAVTASALGGLFGGAVLIVATPMPAEFATGFTAPEYTALAITGLVTVAVISEGSLVRGLLAGCFGLLVATIGTDQFSTGFRLTFGSYHRLDGFHIVAIVVGLFAIPEMVLQVVRPGLDEKVVLPPVRIGLRAVTLTLRHWANLLRSSALGAFFGVIPGASGVASSFVAYAAAKAFAKLEERYGEGA